MELSEKFGAGVVVARDVTMAIDKTRDVSGKWQFDFADVTLAEVLEMCVTSRVIAEQNKLRKAVQANNADALATVKEHTFRVAEHATRAPRVVAKPLTPEEMKAAVLAMNPAEQASYIAALLEIAKKATPPSVEQQARRAGNGK